MAEFEPCRLCGALTVPNDRGKHKRWHDKIDRDIEEAKQSEGY